MKTWDEQGGGAFPVNGMTLRDYFAGQVLATIFTKYNDGDGYANIASDAYYIADAMIRERSGSDTPTDTEKQP